jgi:hypothetical protein
MSLPNSGKTVIGHTRHVREDGNPVTAITGLFPHPNFYVTILTRTSKRPSLGQKFSTTVQKSCFARTEFYTQHHALRVRHSIADHRLGRILCISSGPGRQSGPWQRDNAQNQYETEENTLFSMVQRKKDKAGCKIRPLEFHS